MKKAIVICSLVIAAFGGFGCSGEAYVTAQPTDVVYERPASPGTDYVWVDGDWYWSGGKYAWRNGYWNRPRAGRTYVKGTWATYRQGLPLAERPLEQVIARYYYRLRAINTQHSIRNIQQSILK